MGPIILFMSSLTFMVTCSYVMKGHSHFAARSHGFNCAPAFYLEIGGFPFHTFPPPTHFHIILEEHAMRHQRKKVSMEEALKEDNRLASLPVEQVRRRRG